MQNYLILPACFSTTSLTNSAASISGSTSLIGNSQLFAGRAKLAAGLPGVGPVVATALVAAVDEGRHFRSGRELAAWIGLVPRQYTTGGKPRLGGIGRRANHYLRRQMIHGARSVMFRLAKHDNRRSQWLKGLAARRGFNRTVVALANKTARLAWALLTRKVDYVAA
jgi:transposase